MTTPATAKAFLFIVALGLFVPLWIAVLGFLAQDKCLDLGGGLSGAGYACEFADGRQLGWFELLTIRTLVLSMGVVAAPLFLLFRTVIGRIK